LAGVSIALAVAQKTSGNDPAAKESHRPRYSPGEFVPGTRNAVQGIASRAERAAVIRYLKSLK
jgi:cytochrome c2